MLSNQKDINENREKEIKKLQSDIDEFQKERVQHLECTKAVKGKLEEEQASMKRLRQDLEELKQENGNLKIKIESQQTEIGRFINERNEQGEMKSKLITLNDKLSRKDTEILEYQNKVTISSLFSLCLCIFDFFFNYF